MLTLFVYLGLAGVYALIQPVAYYTDLLGLDFSSPLGQGAGASELGVLAGIYLSIGLLQILVIFQARYLQDFYKYFLAVNVGSILGRAVILVTGYFAVLPIMNMAIEVVFAIFAYWRLQELAKADLPQFLIKDA